MISLKLVNLSKLNGAIQAFSYQYFESPSKPSSIPLSAVREENLTGKQSGKYDIIQGHAVIMLLVYICGFILIFSITNEMSSTYSSYNPWRYPEWK